MSAYRINFTPEPLPRTRRRPLIARGRLVIALTLATWLLVAVLMHIDRPAALATPVRSPDVQVFPLEPIDSPRLAQIRVEAFRAGYATAQQQAGCTTAAANPLADGGRP